MTKDAILGFLRHLLTFGGGVFTAEGIAGADEVTAAVAAAVTLVGFSWSVYAKLRAK